MTTARRACGSVHPDDVGDTEGVRACVMAAGHPTDIDHVDAVGNRWGRRTTAITTTAQAVHPVRGLEDFDERMAAARARSEWELGDPSWAAKIVGAFCDPAVDRSELAREKAAD